MGYTAVRTYTAMRVCDSGLTGLQHNDALGNCHLRHCVHTVCSCTSLPVRWLRVMVVAAHPPDPPTCRACRSSATATSLPSLRSATAHVGQLVNWSSGQCKLGRGRVVGCRPHTDCSTSDVQLAAEAGGKQGPCLSAERCRLHCVLRQRSHRCVPACMCVIASPAGR